MKQHRRLWAGLSGLSLFALLLVGAFSLYTSQARAASDPQDGGPDQAVVEHYFQILNAGMASSDSNTALQVFQALDQVYAPDATLNQSTPTGHTNTFHGIDAIITWYVAFQGMHPGLQFTQDPDHPLRNLAPHVVITYESALPPHFSVPGRCMHVFTLKGGMIETLDWATFFGGTP